MPYSVVDKPSKFFETKLYTGTGATQSITGLNFSPDFVWLKSRGEAQDHYLFDSIRTATKALSSNLTLDEQTYSDSLTSFNSDGFTLGASTRVNKNTFNHVGWCWDANGAGVSNTAGTISSTVSANTTSGFSIVSYSGSGSGAPESVGHGLGVTPKLIIGKNRDSSDATFGRWLVGGSAIPSFNFANDYMVLNSTSAKSTDAGGTVWNSAPTSSVVNFSNFFNTSSNKYIMYCFAEVKGFSKFGSRTGNGSTDGTFVYTGFKPAFVITKRTNTTGNWYIQDNRRTNSFNVVNGNLHSDLSDAENTQTFMDFLSNGFKYRLDGGINTSGDTYIYMAFAENPFVSSTGIPCTAR